MPRRRSRRGRSNPARPASPARWGRRRSKGTISCSETFSCSRRTTLISTIFENGCYVKRKDVKRKERHRFHVFTFYVFTFYVFTFYVFTFYVFTVPPPILCDTHVGGNDSLPAHS